MIKKGRAVYKDDRRIEMTAYMGPRRGGKRFFNESYGNPRDPKAGYDEFWTDQVFRDYKDAGLSFLMPEGDAFFGARLSCKGYAEEPNFEKSDLYRFIQIAERHGLAVYPSYKKLIDQIREENGPLAEKEKAEIKNFVETIANAFPQTFKGIMLTDEPRIQAAECMEEAISCIRECVPDMDIFVAMLPSYGVIDSFDKTSTKEEYKAVAVTYEMKEAYYKDYVETYGKMIGEFSFDHYAFQSNNEETLCPVFYRNLEVVAEIGKKCGFPISITLQAFRMDAGYNPETGKGKEVFRVPSYEDMRYQVYSSLAFGVKRIGYFTFWQHYNEGSGEVFPTAMIVYDEAEENGYRKTSIYDAVKKVNEQILQFDHVFLRYEWKGSRLLRKSNDENLTFAVCDYEDDVLVNVNAQRDLLIGYMENPEDGREGYWIVNAHNPFYYEWNEVEFACKGATHIQYYRAGKEYNVALDENGRFHIRLGAGEGIFVIPYQ